MENKYISISQELQQKLIMRDGLPKQVLRREANRDRATVQRPAYVRDVEKILHHPYYNRYSDKTQVFSFYKNDDITRRALHVQLVSRIGRNIGRLLGLDCDLIEAIALGHDIGHTPFGHAGEKFLSEIYHGRTGRYFNHNVHSVRVLDKIFRLNISLDALNGILCHNGELELKEYRPKPMESFAELDAAMEQCYTDKSAVKGLIPSTMEGCVVRVCDIIAYVGKDRQDAERAGIIQADGGYNSRFINNIVVNLVENSFGKSYISLDDEYFQMLTMGKKDNYDNIYNLPEHEKRYENEIKPLFYELYEYLLKDIGNPAGIIRRHHIDYVNTRRKYYNEAVPYEEANSPDDIVTDYIASMTDDYFIDLCSLLFGKRIKYIGYFKEKGEYKNGQ